jgi:hypothetical protein
MPEDLFLRVIQIILGSRHPQLGFSYVRLSGHLLFRFDQIAANGTFTIREAESNHMTHLHKGDNAAAHPVRHSANANTKVGSNFLFAVPLQFALFLTHTSFSGSTTLSPGEALLVTARQLRTRFSVANKHDLRKNCDSTEGRHVSNPRVLKIPI